MAAERKKLTWQECLLHALLLIVPLVFVFPKTFTAGEMIAPGDILYEIPPWKAHTPPELEEKLLENSDRLILDAITAMDTYYMLTERALDNGEWPLWNHLELAGMPLMANCQSAVFYPPRLVHRFFEFWTATTLYILMKLWLCGMTMYLCLRLLLLGRPAARLASFAWMLASYNLIWSYWPLPDVSAWAPVLFLGVELILRERYQRGFFALAFGASLVLLAGHPESAFVFSLGLGFYFFLRLVFERRWGGLLMKPIVAAGGAWVVALLVYSVTLIPFLEYLANSWTVLDRVDRPVDQKAYLYGSTAAAFWVPRFLGTWVEQNFWGKWNSNLTGMVYPGVTMWLAASLLLVKGSWSKRAKMRAIALTISGVIFGMFAFYVPPLQFIHDFPPFNTMYECYHVAWTVFVIMLLGAFGLDRWFARERAPKETLWMLVPTGLAVLVVGFIYAFQAAFFSRVGHLSYVHVQILIAVAVLLASAGIIVASCYFRKPAITGAALVIVMSADLVLALRGINSTSPPEQLFIQTEITDFLLAQEQPCRAGVAMGLIPGGIMPIYGVEQWTGYDGLYPERVKGFQERLRTDIWHVMEPVCGVQYYLHNTNLPEFLFPYEDRGGFELVFSAEQMEVYKNTFARPTATLVGRGRVVSGTDAMFEIMASKDYDPTAEVLLEAPLPVALPENPPADLGTVEITDRQSTYVDLTANAAAPCILVLADCYYPGWKAYIDDEPTEIFSAYYAFRGIVLPEGEHTVRFRYEPWTFYAGLAVSSVTCIAGILVALYILLVQRRKKRTTQTVAS